MGLKKELSSSNPAMRDQAITLRQAARIAGFGILIMAFAGPVAELLVFPKLGVFGSLLIAAGSFAIIIFPNLAKIVGLTYMMPGGVFEVTMGFWLLIKGLRPYRAANR